MQKHLVVVGDPPEKDLSCIREAAADFGIAVKQDRISPGAEWTESESPVGYLSFLPCREEALLSFFSEIPVGSAQDIPFYQNASNGYSYDWLHRMPLHGFFRSPLDGIHCRSMLAGMVHSEGLIQQNHSLLDEAVKYRWEKNKLITMGLALSSTTDPDVLLTMILTESREAVGADAGSLYVREQSGPGGDFTNRILFKIAQNDSVNVEKKAKEIPIPINQRTISGYVACTGNLLNIEDVYHLDASVPYSWAQGFDKRFSYRMKSMLTVPLKNMAGEVVGVLQLMNKKSEKKAILTSPEAVETYVTAFSRSDEGFVQSIASLAAVSIERVQLYKNIEKLFEGFLGASTAAIDERDRVTSGHSRRVAGYAMAFVEKVNEDTTGPFKHIHFSPARKRQFKFAAMLHDIGKIGVPETLLTRETRISEGQMEAIRTRGEYIRLRMNGSGHQCSVDWESVAALDEDMALLEKINKAGFVPEEELQALGRMKEKSYVDSKGEQKNFLREYEFEHLSIPKGNLTFEEREIINFHAVATRRILSKIPWTRELKGIPSIASHHHEKLDGSGYPDHLKREEISLESRILAVIDIYEALVAQDRPYKRRMTPERALEILQAEVRANHLDSEIVDFFVEREVYKLFLTESG